MFWTAALHTFVWFQSATQGACKLLCYACPVGLCNIILQAAGRAGWAGRPCDPFVECIQVLKRRVKPYVPDFKLAFEHVCIHTGACNSWLGHEQCCVLYLWRTASLYHGLGICSLQPVFLQ